MFLPPSPAADVNRCLTDVFDGSGNKNAMKVRHFVCYAVIHQVQVFHPF